MGTNYPGSLDSWTNPSPDTMMDATSFEHDVAHSNAYDAIEAIEGELGTDPSGAHSTVKDRFDYVSRMPMSTFIWRSGDYISNQYTTSSSSVTLTMSITQTYYFPLWVPRSRTIDRASVAVESPGTSANIRLGLYSATSEMVPDSLITTFGTVSGASTGLKEATVSQAVTGGTLYYFALQADVQCGLRGLTNGAARSILARTGGVGGVCGFSQDQTYASGLPSTATLQWTQDAIVPIVYARAA